jgi:hypothetical protein
VAKIQVLLDDHLAGGKRSAVDVVARAQAVLTEEATTGDVRCWLLPAEHPAVARNSARFVMQTKMEKSSRRAYEVPHELPPEMLALLMQIDANCSAAEKLNRRLRRRYQ